MAYIFHESELPSLNSEVPGRERIFFVNQELAKTDDMLFSLTSEKAGPGRSPGIFTSRKTNAMSSESQYKRFAVASLNSTEVATDLSNKVGLLIMAEAWIDLAEQTTQIVDHEANEAHWMIEQPLKRASVQGH